jgi:acetyl esterase/lipase
VQIDAALRFVALINGNLRVFFRGNQEVNTLRSLAFALVATFGTSSFPSDVIAAELQATANPTNPPRAALWNGRAPIGDGKFEQADAWITVHRPENSNGAAVVICPGGGYGSLVVGAEGHGIANWLNRHGITGIVLEYRLPAGRPFVPLLDAQRAIRTVRANAKEWKVDPARVGITGFSAGGHLASTAGTHFDDGDSGAADATDRFGCRPDFLILVYPVIVMDETTHQGCKNNLFGKNPLPQTVERFSNEKHVTGRTPPAYLAHALDDKAVPPQHSRVFHKALQDHQVPSEYVELPRGGHGLDGYKGPMWDAWQNGSLDWLARLKIIPADRPTSPAK